MRHLTACLPELGNVGQARLTAVAAPSADSWLKAIPSWNQDTLLSNAAFRDSLSMRLGIRVFEDGRAAGLVLSVKIFWTRMVTIV